MPDDFHFFAHIFQSVDRGLLTFSDSAVGDVIATFTETGRRVLVLYVCLWGWSLSRGLIQEPFPDALVRVVRVILVCSMCFSVASYHSYVAELLWQSPDAFAELLNGNANAGGSGGFLDAAISKTFDFGDLFWQKSVAAKNTFGIPDLGLAFSAFAIWAIGMLSTGYAAFLLVLAKVLLSMLLALGPIFIFALLFSATRRFFEAWIAAVVNCVLSVALTAAMVRLLFTILQEYLSAAAQSGAVADPAINQALPAIAVCGIASLVFIQVPSLASSLAGGLTLSTLRGASWLAGTSRNVVSSMRPTAIAREVNRAKADWRLIKATGEHAVNFGRR